MDKMSYQPKAGLSKVWIIVITVILAGGLTGGGAYAYLNNKATKEKNDLQVQIDTANKKVEDLTAQVAATTSTTSSTATTSTSTSATATNTSSSDAWKTYTNSQYKFSLQFPDSWKGYTTKERKTSENSLMTIYFSLPTTDKSYPNSDDSAPGSASIFAMTIYTPAGWDQEQKDAAADGAETGRPLKETSSYVYLWTGAQDYPTDLMSIAKSTTDDIFASFENI